MKRRTTWIAAGVAAAAIAIGGVGMALANGGSDTGSGFPPDFLAEAGAGFRRPDEGRARGSGGTGLGLAIVRTIVEAHGGTLSIENRAEGGARVAILLPVGR